MLSILKIPAFLLLYFLVILVFAGGTQVQAQQLDPEPVGDSNVQDLNSCTLRPSPGSTDDFVRLMPQLGNTASVKVNIAFQIGDYTPCHLETSTPVELPFPKGRFSFRLEPEEEDARYRFILNKTGTGPVVWFSEISKICAVVNEDWDYEIGCDAINY